MERSASDRPRTLEQAGSADSNPATTAGPEPPLSARIFFGAEGLRALWGVLLFLAICEALRYSLYPLIHRFLPPSAGKSALILPRTVFVSEGGGLFCIALATWLMARIERRPVTAYGFGPQRAVRNFCAGLAWGVALLSLLVFLLRACGLLVFDARLLFGGAVMHYALIWLAGFLLVGLLEELFSRGYLQFTLTRGLSALYRWLFGAAHATALGFWTAAFALSFIFGAGHGSNPGESPLGLLSAGLAGFLFCLSLWRTGSLWWAIGFHTTWDWAQSFLYGVADSGLMAKGPLLATHAVGRTWLSGGLTGPEGSLLFLPVALIGAGVVLLTLPRTHLGYIPLDAQRSRLD